MTSGKKKQQKNNKRMKSKMTVSLNCYNNRKSNLQLNNQTAEFKVQFTWFEFKPHTYTHTEKAKGKVHYGSVELSLSVTNRQKVIQSFIPSFIYSYILQYK